MPRVNSVSLPGETPMAQIALRLPESMLDGIKMVAEKEERTYSSVLRHAIRLYLEAYENASS